MKTFLALICLLSISSTVYSAPKFFGFLKDIEEGESATERCTAADMKIKINEFPQQVFLSTRAAPEMYSSIQIGSNPIAGINFSKLIGPKNNEVDEEGSRMTLTILGEVLIRSESFKNTCLKSTLTQFERIVEIGSIDAPSLAQHLGDDEDDSASISNQIVNYFDRKRASGTLRLSCTQKSVKYLTHRNENCVPEVRKLIWD